jgi:enoyl-CoA hydratase/carnithine racemase
MEPEMSEHVLVTIQDRILRIQLNRPEKKNALTRAMYQGIADGLRQADADDNVRVTLITGTQDCFTSGNDLMDFLQAPPTEITNPPGQFLTTISGAQKPIVAAVNGVAVGVGTTMLLHCDLVYAGEGARFILPFVSLGLSPEAAASLLLPQMLGYHRAAELLLLGEPMDADQALAWGFVNGVYPAAEVEERAWQAALKIAAMPPSSVQTTKALMKRPLRSIVEETMVVELKEFAAKLQQPAAREAMQAFLEKRKPDFSRF